jgi:putative ABC transport system permease protein
MVFIGAAIPAKRAAKITPVEAAKFSPGNLNKKKKIKIIENINLTSLARINLFRRKSGTWGTIISLSVVGILFISWTCIMFSAYNSTLDMARTWNAMDIKIAFGFPADERNWDPWKQVLPENTVEKIINLDGVTESKVIYSQGYGPIDNGVVSSMNRIIGADDEIIKELLQHYPADIAEDIFYALKNDISSVLVLNPMYHEDRDKYGIKAGEEVTVNLYDFWNYRDMKIKETEETFSMNIIGEAENYRGYIIVSEYPNFLMPLSSFIANNFIKQCETVYLNIEDSKYDSIAANLEEICIDEGNITYYSYKKDKERIENQMTGSMILVMTEMGIMIAAGLLNLISTTFMGIEQRKKEIGILSALGGGLKEIAKMLKLELIWITIISTIISIIGGVFFHWLFYLLVKSMGDYIIFTFPIAPVIIFVLTYIFIPYIISSVAVRRLLKNTTVELIGQEI